MNIGCDSHFTVYIDEGGDPGVTDGLKYRSSPHQWMTLGAFVVRSSLEDETEGWIKTIRQRNSLLQGKSLHYNRLSPHRARRVCGDVGRLQCRAFCLASYKDNLRNYHNPKLGHMSAGDYYNWCCRLLLERIMHWALAQMQIDGTHGEARPLKIFFSEKGGHNYDHMFSYFENLNIQAQQDSFKKPPKCWDPSLMNRSFWRYRPDYELAGLQFADIVASSFLHAANSSSPRHSLEPALQLRSILAKGSNKRKMDCGITLWPLQYQSPILENDRKIFSEFGYKFRNHN